VQKRCADLGFTLEGEELIDVYRALMAIADDRKMLTDNDLRAVVASFREEQVPADAVDPFDTPAAAGLTSESGYGHGV
jgi:hypothetical protein